MLRYKLVQRKDMTRGALENAKLYYPQVINQGRVSYFLDAATLLVQLNSDVTAKAQEVAA